MRLSREIGGEGFDDMSDSDVTAITQPTTGLAAEEIHEILYNWNVHEESELSDIEEPILKLVSISRIVQSKIQLRKLSTQTRSWQEVFDLNAIVNHLNHMKNYIEIWHEGLSKKLSQNIFIKFKQTVPWFQ